MRKLILLFGGIPASIRRICNKILPITTKILAALQSGYADDICKLIPGDTDNTIRIGLISALQELQIALKAITDEHVRKDLMGAVVANAMVIIDGKQHSSGEYRAMFDKVYQETKTA